MSSNFPDLSKYQSIYPSLSILRNKYLGTFEFTNNKYKMNYIQFFMFIKRLLIY